MAFVSSAGARFVHGRDGRLRSRNNRCRFDRHNVARMSVEESSEREDGLLDAQIAGQSQAIEQTQTAEQAGEVEQLKLENAHLEQKGFRSWRFRVMFGLYFSYVVYSVTRATFTFVSPTLQNAGILTLFQIGAVTSTFPMMYGGSKLVSGFLADNVSPRLVLACGMMLTGAANVGLALTSSFRGFTAMWGLNGLVQGVGAGAVARILTSWYTRRERGFWWAAWSTSANFGGFLAPIICSWLVSTYSWQAGAFVPGIAAVVSGLFMIPLLRDDPSDLSYEVNHDETPKSTSSDSSAGKEPFMKIFVERVLLNRSIWLLAISNIFIYFLRSGMRSWHHFYIANLRGITTAEAAYRVSGMEIGGLFGTFSSGVISDRVKGSRVPVIIAYLIGLGLTFGLIAMLPAMNPLLDTVIIGLLGFFINGPQCLIGLVGAEAVDRRTVATATGILGWVSYLGAAISGFPITMTVKHYGWDAYLGLLSASTFFAGLFLLPLWKKKDHEAEEKQ